MRNGFTKIPNYILDMPWATNPTVVYLYTWLSLHADKNGVVRMSLNEISSKTNLNKMQVRRALEKLRLTQVVTQVTTQPATQLPSVITVCYLSDYKVLKNICDIASDTACNTSSNTPRAYKNDNINIMSIQDYNKTIPPLSPKGETQFDWSDVPEDMVQIVNDWLKYKKEKRQTYKPVGFKTFVKRLRELSSDDAVIARLIVEQSMANNYSGIFKLKSSDNGTTQTTQRTYQGSEHPTDSELRSNTIELIQRLSAERHARNAKIRERQGLLDESDT